MRLTRRPDATELELLDVWFETSVCFHPSSLVITELRSFGLQPLRQPDENCPELTARRSVHSDAITTHVVCAVLLALGFPMEFPEIRLRHVPQENLPFASLRVSRLAPAKVDSYPTQWVLNYVPHPHLPLPSFYSGIESPNLSNSIPERKKSKNSIQNLPQL